MSQSPLPQATDRQFQKFIELVKSSQIEQVKDFLNRYNSSILSRLQIGFRQPALYFAITTNNDNACYELAKLLVEKGANPKHKDQNDQTVLFYACRDGKLQCCKFLIEQGLSLDENDMYGQTPLFYVASENKINLINLFEPKDFQNHVDKLAGQTALYYAARKGHRQMCEQLIRKGMNPAHIDNQGKTAAQYAKKAKHLDTAELLNVEIRKIKQPSIPYSADISGGRQQSYQIDRKKKKQTGNTTTVQRATYKIVYMNEKGESKDLTQQEVRNLIKTNPELETYFNNPNSIPKDELQKVHTADLWQKAATKLLQTIMKHKGAFWFLQPVDPVKYNIMDYFDIVQKPMDLGTIKKKLSHNVYRDANHFVEDLNLIWNNCIKYNGQAHQISKVAKQLEIIFIDQFKKSELQRFMNAEQSE